MGQEKWAAVDQYVSDLLVTPDPVLEAALQASTHAGLPEIQVTAAQGKFLNILAQTVQARSILEIGTLGGYSTIWLARALQTGGKLVSLEADPKHAQVAQENLKRAGLETVAEVRIGRAIETLPQLAAEGHNPFDLVFIDADKPSTAEYFEWAVRLTRRGGLIITDNVVRDGGVADPKSKDASVQGVQRFNAAMAAEKRVTGIVVQTVGAKGYDGFAIALVIGE